jgi:TonB-dependent starch-binding outer membrane protein SusC
MKKLLEHVGQFYPRIKKLLLIMRLSVLLILIAVFSSAASVYSQETKLTLKMENARIAEVFDAIEEQSEFIFFYNRDYFDDNRIVSVDFKDKKIDEVLKELFKRQSVEYEVFDRNIVIKVPHTYTDFARRVYQQQRTVSGTVADADGQPLPGVTIVVKGTTRGTTTNTDGEYSLSNISSDATLVFSFVGMKTQEIVVGDQANINITMEGEVIGIEEVVAIGYGTQMRREVTGSIVNVEATDLEDLPVGQISQKLQGKLAGVHVNSSTGYPGRDISIRIRGAASINAGNQPLYVIDGFPLTGGLAQINPDEIEDISVLKGSSASSMYGSRAANGVVLITTKRAKEGQSILKVDINYGVGQVPQRGRPELMNAKEFLADRKAWWEDKIRYEGYTGGVPELYQNPDAWTGPDTDWYDELLRIAPRSNYSISFLTDMGKFSSANIVGYYKEDGVLLNSGYQRYSLRSNNEYEVNHNIRIGLNVAPTYQLQNNISNTDGFYSTIYAAIITPAIFSPDEKNPDGSPVLSYSGPGLFGFPNWKVTLEDQVNDNTVFRLLSNAYIVLNFLKYFEFRSSLSADLGNSFNRAFSPSTIGSIFQKPPNRQTGSYSSAHSLSWINENTINFKRIFADDHHFNILAGFSAQEYSYENGGVNADEFPDDMIEYLSAAANATGFYNGASEWSLLSVIGRLNYNYKERYLLSASIRQDGCSRFGSDNKWSSFPSASIGWIISDENFAANWNALSYLKLRAEYGVVGNFNIGNYTQYGNISSSNYVFNDVLVSGRGQTSLGNSFLTWETTGGFDFGLDVALFNNRLAVTMDYYDKSNEGMLYQVDIPWGTGYSNIQDNIGEFHFWGYEFALQTKNFVRDFKWNTDFNITFDRNKVLKLGVNDEPIGATSSTYPSGSNRSEVGHPIGMFYGFVSDGIYMTQEEYDTQPKYVTSAVGTVRYKDVNGDGEITIDDRTFIGNPNPKFIFGITNNFSYKNFDLSVIMSGAYDVDRMVALKEWTETLEGIFNVEKYMKDRWRSLENPGAGIIGRNLSGTTEFARNAQSRYVEDASHLTINNITLGYTLPKINYIKNARIYFSIQQALVLTKYSGVNPEASLHGLNALNEGIDVSPYPIPRIYTMGVDINF